MLVILLAFVSQNSFAQPEYQLPKLEDLKALDYPELQVVPRASERLEMGAIAVKDRGVMLLFPYMASSVMTLAAGVIVNSSIRPELSENDKREASVASKFAIGIGAAGIGLAYWFTYSDNYGITLAQIRGFKNKDRRTELFKERLSEEVFEKTAKQASQWKWVFATANLLTSLQLTGKSTGANNIVPTLGVAAALLPLFITTSYETNYRKQLEYKRRIYVPLTWFDYQYNARQASWQPQLNAVWTF